MPFMMRIPLSMICEPSIAFALILEQFSLRSCPKKRGKCVRRRTSGWKDRFFSISSRKRAPRSLVRLPTPQFSFVVGSHAVVVAEIDRFPSLSDASFIFVMHDCVYVRAVPRRKGEVSRFEVRVHYVRKRIEHFNLKLYYFASKVPLSKEWEFGSVSCGVA